MAFSCCIPACVGAAPRQMPGATRWKLGRSLLSACVKDGIPKITESMVNARATIFCVVMTVMLLLVISRLYWHNGWIIVDAAILRRFLHGLRRLLNGLWCRRRLLPLCLLLDRRRSSL